MNLFTLPHGGLYIGSAFSNGTLLFVPLNGGLVCGSLTVWFVAGVTHFVKATPYVLPLRAKECAGKHRCRTATQLGMSAGSSTLPGVSVVEWEEFLAELGEGEVTPALFLKGTGLR